MDKDSFKNTLTSQRNLKYFLKENHLYLKKRLGQNFLFDRNIILKITENIFVKNKHVVEIGPGIGNLTLFYHQLPGQIILIEIDKGFNKILRKLFADSKHISIIHHDFLKYDLSKVLRTHKKYIFLSNLPYKSGSQILIKLLDYYNHIEEVYIMAPHIYYEKFISPNRKYGNRLSVLLNLFFKIRKLFTVSKNSFFPVPEIDSVFMKLTPEKKVEDLERAKIILSFLFKQKRKKLKKILEKHDKKNILNPYYNKRIDEIELKEIIYIINNFTI